MEHHLVNLTLALLSAVWYTEIRKQGEGTRQTVFPKTQNPLRAMRVFRMGSLWLVAFLMMALFMPILTVGLWDHLTFASVMEVIITTG